MRRRARGFLAQRKSGCSRGAGAKAVQAMLAVGAVATLLLVLLAAPAFAAFPDVPSGHAYYTAVEGMAARGIIGGKTDGTFRPDEPVLRAQFAKMIDGTMGIQVTEGGLPMPPFTDMGQNDPITLYPHDYVAAVAANGITTGYADGTFRPYIGISRAQLITMVVRAANSLEAGKLAPVPAGFQPTIPFFSDIHSPLMDQAEANGLLAGLVGFSASWDPNAQATRGECAQVLWNLIGKLEELEPPVGGGPFLTFAELKPTPPIAYTISLDLSEARVVAATAQGLMTAIPINDMSVTGHLTVQIVSVTATAATLQIALNALTLPPDLGTTGLSTYLPLVLTMVVDEKGLVQSIQYSSAGEPAQSLNAQQMAQIIPLLAPFTELLFVPNFSQLEEVGKSVDFVKGYSVPGGPKVVDLNVHATFESLQGEVAVLSYKIAATNINTTVIVDIMPLLSEIMGAPPAPGETAILVVRLTGQVTAEGSVNVDVTTGLPVAATSAARLRLRAGIQQAPPQLAQLVPGFEQVSALTLDAKLGTALDQE
jgi:hypothetical protein